MKTIGLTQRVEDLKDKGGRRDCLDQAWARLIMQIGMLPVPLPNCLEDVGGAVLKLGLDGVVLTGGNDLAHLQGAKNTAPERDAFEHNLLTVCSERNIPVLGVCRGLQMMVVHYGGELAPVAKHVATCHGLEVQCSNNVPINDREKVNSFHNYSVARNGIGNDLIIVAIAPDGAVEAVAHSKYPQCGIMWHPERPPYNKDDVALIRELFK